MRGGAVLSSNHVVLVGFVILASCGGAWLLLSDADPSELSTAAARRAFDEPAAPVPAPNTAERPHSGIPTQALTRDVTPRAGAIQGTIVRPDGTHVARAEVRIRLSTPPGQRSYALVTRFDETVSTDGEGRFQIDVPGGGVYRVTARAEAYAPGIQGGVRPGDVIILGLVQPAGLRGVVLEEETERPLAGVRVTAWLPSPHNKRDTQTDATGAFAFAALPTGLVRLHFDATDHVSTHEVEEQVEPDATAEVTVHLAAGKVIAGSVVATGDDRPIAHAVITAGSREVTTDERGRFALRGLVAAQLTVEVRGPGYLPQSRAVNLAGSRRHAEVAFRLTPGATVFGRVIDVTGEPIVGARVRLYVSRNEKTGAHNTCEHYGTRKLDVRTDESGRYEIAGIEPNNWYWYLARVHVDGMPIAWSLPVKIRAPDDRLSANVRFGVGGEIIGRVFDQDRKPIGGARVAVTPHIVGGLNAQDQATVGVTDSEGEFRISGVSDGRYTVVVDARGYARGWKGSVSVVRNRGPGELEFELGMGAPLHGHVSDVSGKPLEGVRVDAWSGGGHGMAMSDAQGRFEMESVPKGPWRVTARLVGYAQWGGRNIETEGEGGIKIEMAPQAVLVGQVLDTAGEPIKSFQVTLARTDQQDGRRHSAFSKAISDREGRFTIQRPDGEYEFFVTSRGYVGHSGQKIVFDAVDPQQPIEVRLRKGGGIEGYVRDERGRPISGVQIYQRRGLPQREDYSRAVRTEHDGYFFIGDLDAGFHDLVFHGGGRPIASWESVCVGGDQPAWVEATLRRDTKLVVTVRKPAPKNKSPIRLSWRGWGNYQPGVSIEVTSLDQSDLIMQRTTSDTVRGHLYGTASRRRLWVSNKLSTTELPVGRYEIVASLNGHPDIVRRVSLGFGAEQPILFDFRPPKKPTDADALLAGAPGSL